MAGSVVPKGAVVRAIAEAQRLSDSEAMNDHNECICPGNLLLFLFFKELQRETREAQESGTDIPDRSIFSLSKIANSVKRAPTRIWSKEKAQKQLDGVGAYYAKMIQALFNKHPPDPPTPEEEEMEEAIAESQKASKAAGKQKTKGKRTAAAAVTTGTISGGNAAPAGGVAAAEDAPRGKKAKAPKAKVPYCPKPGTANWAFMITLFKQHRKGVEHMGKDELMRMTEDSRLATVSIYGRANPSAAFNQPNQHYDGWSCFNNLHKKDPPLVLRWSNPVKVQLTPQGMALADQLCRSAVLSGRTSPPPERQGGQASFLDMETAPLPGHLSGGYGGVEEPKDKPEQPRRSSGGSFSTKPPGWNRDRTSAGSSHQAATAFVSAAVPRMPLSDVGGRNGSGSAAIKAPPPAAAKNKLDDDDVVVIISDDEDDEPQPQCLKTGVAPAADAPHPPMAAPRPSHPRVENLKASAELLQQQRRLSTGSSGLLVSSSQEEGGSQFTSSQSDPSRLERGEWRLERPREDEVDAVRRLRCPPLRPGSTFADDYEVLMLLDTRETYTTHIAGKGACSRTEAFKHHMERLQRQGVPVEARCLKAGDVVWVAKSRVQPRLEYVLDAILERKRMDDLVGSIKNGRHDTQKYFMRHSGLRMLYYLIEGSVDHLNSATEQKMAKTASVQNEMIHGYRVLRTEGAQQTFDLLSRMTRNFKAMYSSLRGSTVPGECLPTFAEFEEKVAQQKQLTVRDFWGKVLTSVPGVGPNAASTILEHYPTPMSLHKAYKEVQRQALSCGDVPAKAAEAMLRDVPILNKQHQRIGPKVSQNIYIHLFSQQ